MKIAFLLQSFPCISETFILNQVTSLIDLGCDIRIFAFGKPDDQKQHPDVARYKLLDKTTYIQPPKRKSAKRFKATGQILKRFIRHPVLSYRLQKRLLKDGRSYSYPKLFLALAIMGEQFDILHCHYGTMGAIAVILKDIGYHTKIATAFHGYDLSAYLKEKGQNVYAELIKKGDLFLPVSEYFAQKLSCLGCPANKIIVSRMGVDTDYFKPSFQKDTQSPIKLLTIARLTEKKGHTYALQAVKKLIEDGFNFEYHIAGTGPLMSNLADMEKSLGILGRVFFHGEINSDEALQLYQTSDIFLLPSFTPPNGDMEGVPVSLMEAMSCGLPVVSTQHSGIPELVIEGKTGFLVPEKDVDALANAIRELLGNPKKRDYMGQQGRLAIQKKFEAQELNRRLNDFYKRTLS